MSKRKMLSKLFDPCVCVCVLLVIIGTSIRTLVNTQCEVIHCVFMYR